jgi:hypothetical protein
VKCHARQKTPVRLQVARSQAQECIASNMRGFSLRIESNATKNVVLRTRAATIADINVGAHSFCVVIHSARLRDFATALPNQLKPITSLRFAQADRDSRSRMDKALASLVTLGRQRQKTPISLDAESRGVVKSLQIEMLETPLLAPSTRPRN